MDPSRGRLADVDRRSGDASDPADRPAPSREPRQRWRIAFARGPVDADQVGRIALDAWQETLLRSGLPVAGLDGPDGRARIAFGAPLPAAARGERELLELWLVERIPVWRLRESLRRLQIRPPETSRSAPANR